MYEKLPEGVTKLIREEVKRIRDEYKIENIIIRNDIFELLENLCVVLQYPLENDESANGLHVERWVSGRKKHFVFINSSNPLEKRVYTAAHELGHVWKIDEKVAEKLGGSIDEEAVINRFAAELLMPEGNFLGKLSDYCQKNDIKSGIIEEAQILPLIVYLMNEFMVPYKAIVYRMYETNIISGKDSERLEMIERENPARLTGLIGKGNYQNLNQIKFQKSMGNIETLLKRAEKQDIYPEAKIKSIREAFDIESVLQSIDGTEIVLEIPEA